MTEFIFMDSIAHKIEAKINTFKKGRIFFVDDFALDLDLSTSDSIRQTLLRLTNRGKIIRVAQGIYCYPEIDKKLGLGVIKPSPDKIAEAIANRAHARIIPTGEYALNVLGLSTQVPMNYVFLTDGSSRRVKMANGRYITFKRVSPKNVSFSNRLAMLVTLALKSIKQKNVTQEQLQQIKNLLREEEKEKILKDLRLMPVWIRNIVNNAYE